MFMSQLRTHAEGIVGHRLRNTGVSYIVKLQNRTEPQSFSRSHMLRFCEQMTKKYDQRNREIQEHLDMLQKKTMAPASKEALKKAVQVPVRRARSRRGVDSDEKDDMPRASSSDDAPASKRSRSARLMPSKETKDDDSEESDDEPSPKETKTDAPAVKKRCPSIATPMEVSVAEPRNAKKNDKERTILKVKKGKKGELWKAQKIISHTFGQFGGVTYIIELQGHAQPAAFFRSDVVRVCKHLMDEYEQNHPEILEAMTRKRSPSPVRRRAIHKPKEAEQHDNSSGDDEPPMGENAENEIGGGNAQPKEASESDGTEEAEDDDEHILDAPSVENDRANDKPKEAPPEDDSDNEDDQPMNENEIGFGDAQSKEATEPDDPEEAAEDDEHIADVPSVENHRANDKSKEASPEDDSDNEDDQNAEGSLKADAKKRRVSANGNDSEDSSSGDKSDGEYPGAPNGQPREAEAFQEDGVEEPEINFSMNMSQVSERLSDVIRRQISMMKDRQMVKEKIGNAITHLKAVSKIMEKEIKDGNTLKDDLIHLKEDIDIIAHRHSAI